MRGDDSENAGAEEEARDVFLELSDGDLFFRIVLMRKFFQGFFGDGDAVNIMIEVNSDEVVLVFDFDSVLPGDAAPSCDFSDALGGCFALVAGTRRLEAVDPDCRCESLVAEGELLAIDVGGSFDGGRNTGERFDDELHDLGGGAQAHRKAVHFVEVVGDVEEAEVLSVFFGDLDLEEGDLEITGCSAFVAHCIHESAGMLELTHLWSVIVLENFVDFFGPADEAETFFSIFIFENKEWNTERF